MDNSTNLLRRNFWAFPLLFVAVYTSWMIGPNITDYAGWIKSQEVGLQNIPTSGWSYVDDRSQYVHDDKLFFIYN